MILDVILSYLFDPAWLCLDKQVTRPRKEFVCDFDEFTNSYLSQNQLQFRPDLLFPGAFTYHLHFHGRDIHEGSYFAQYEKHFASKLTLN
jgi:hypothetical protein